MAETVDVLVIGGGIVGVSAAFEIASRPGSRRVMLLEAAEELGTGSTAKATGGIRHQFSSRVNMQLTMLSMPVYARFAEEMHRPIGLRQNGYLLVTRESGTMEALNASVAMQQDAGLPTRVVSPAEAKELFPALHTDDLAGGSFCPIDGSANPTDALDGYRAGALENGVAIRLNEPVRSVVRKGDRVVGVRTDRETYAAEVVINAAGPRAMELSEHVGVALPARAYRRQVFVAEPISSLSNTLPMLVDLDTGWYLHQEASGALLLGGTDATTRPGIVEAVDWDAFDRVADAVLRRTPTLADLIRIRSAYCGIRVATPDSQPIIGRTPNVEGYLCATACNGHGFMHAPAVAQLLADIVETGSSFKIDIDAVAITRFSGESAPAEAVVF